MGFFDFFKPKVTDKPAAKTFVVAPTQSGGQPVQYSSGETAIYANDIVLQAIRCKANEMKKLEPRHIREKDGQQKTIYDSSIAKALRRPNQYMTTADLLEKITILLELNKNAYVYPAYYMTKGGEKYYTGIYPLKPVEVWYLIDKSDQMFIKMRFANGYTHTFHVSEITHIRHDYGVNDYFGGAEHSRENNAGLMEAISQYETLCNSIAKAMDISCKINGIMRVNTYMSDETQETAQREFNRKLKDNESGILFTDAKAEYINLPRDVKLVDAETIKFFYQNITRSSGVSLPILNGDYTKAQKEAFYEHALEADIKNMGQALSKTIFTENEESHGNKIVLFPHDITFMSMENKLTALQHGLPAGIFTKNEARALLGYPPIEGGDVMPRGYNELDTTQKEVTANE